ncbi:MAG: S-layer homology domain-containing protein [Trueperaceae bacterium]|nr:S-layer homology domain-containing protein [Trueperaceae bacterium]
MKRLLIVCLATLTASGAFAQQPPFPDIPAGHWSSDAVARIADLGIVIGFPDGTFRGNESFTRYQAALVIDRLLDVIGSDLNAALALTNSDIAALRNALQELAADVAAQGSSLATLSDVVISNEDRITALEAALDQAVVVEGTDPAVIADLEAQIAELRAQTEAAQARAASAEAIAQGAQGAVDELAVQVRQNERSLEALNDLVALLNQDINTLLAEGLAGGEGIDTGFFSDIEQNTSDIANIREFVILLRRNQVALSGRVSALEETDAAQTEAIADLDERLSFLEDQALLISGSIALDYDVVRFGLDAGATRPALDVDRVFGRGLERPRTSFFSTGESDDGEDDNEEVTDFDGPVNGEVTPELELTFEFGIGRDAVGDPNALNSFTGVIELGIERDFSAVDGDGDSFRGYVFSLEELTTTFDPIGAAPLEFGFGEAIEVEFTDYVLDSNFNGFTARLGAPDFLAFLAPTLDIVYGVPSDDDEPFDTIFDADTYARGIRGTLSPFTGFTGGIHFVQAADNAVEHADGSDDNVTTTILGLDGQINISIFDVAFEYARADTFDNATDSSLNPGGDAIPLFYVTLNLDVEDIPVLTAFEASYRDIPGIWATTYFSGDINSQLAGDDGDYPFDLDQAGFQVGAGLELFVLDVVAYFDTYEIGQGSDGIADADTESVTAFGVSADADLFAGFAINGFFRNASIDGTSNSGAVDDVESAIIEGDPQTVIADAEGADRDDNNYSTGFGVGLVHDGASDNALIPRLNLEAGFERINAGYDTTRIYAEGDYTLEVSILTLTPYAGFESIDNPDPSSDDTVTLQAGTGLETAILNVVTRPSLFANVNFRNTDHSDVGADPDYTTTVLQYSVGLALNEFILDNSVLTAKYGSYSGTNTDITYTAGADADVAAPGDDTFRSDLTTSTTGYEVTWNYFDLEFGYGVFVFDPDTATADNNTVAQAFSISYKVTF